MKKAGRTVSLDGHGVDEMMYGYLDNVYTLYYHYLQRHDKRKAENLANIIYRLYHADKQEGVKEKLNKETQRTSWIKAMIPKKRSALNVQGNAYLLDKIQGEPYDFHAYPIEDQILLEEFLVKTLPSLLRNFDRASMMNGIEIRMPFMDYRLVAKVFSMPTSYKLNQGFTKWILRTSMKSLMPETIRTRTFKVGIASPWDSWINGPLYDWCMDYLSNPEYKLKAETEKKEGKIKPSTAKDIWLFINKELMN